MLLSLLKFGTAAAAAALLTACGARSPDRPTTTRNLAAGIDTQGSRVTEATVLGVSIPFIGDAAPRVHSEARELVAIVRMMEPAAIARPSGDHLVPAAGFRYLAVGLRIDNVGAPTYRGNPGQETSLISQNLGGHVGQRVAGVTGPGLCARNLLRSIALRSGQTARGCVFFKIPTIQRVSAVQYETQGGIGQNIATWAVNRSSVHG